MPLLLQNKTQFRCFSRLDSQSAEYSKEALRDYVKRRHEAGVLQKLDGHFEVLFVVFPILGPITFYRI